MALYIGRLALGLGLVLPTARRHSRRRWEGVALREDDAGGRAEAHDRAAGEEDGGGLGLGLGFANLTLSLSLTLTLTWRGGRRGVPTTVAARTWFR